MRIPSLIYRSALLAVFVFCVSMPTLAASYFEVAERLVPEEHTELRQQWLESNEFNAEQLAVIEAIYAFYNDDVDAAEALLTPYLKQAKNPETLYWAGRIYGRLASEASIFKAGSLAEQALDSFKLSVNMDPSFIPGHHALVQYYIHAPFFAGGSTEKALETANSLSQLAPLEGALAQLNIALSEQDEEQVQAQLASIENHLASAEKDNAGSLSGNYYRIALHYMELENYDAASRALNTSLSYNDKALAMPLSDTLESQLEHQEYTNARQAILYQTGRLGVFSEANIKVSIAALESFLEGPEHPTYERHWAQLRYAQLLFNDGQIQAANAVIEVLPDVNNKYYEEELKTLRKRIRKQAR